MNLFSDYHKKILSYLNILEKKEIIILQEKFKNFTLELPPKNQKADMSCNVALILAKHNSMVPTNFAEIIKKNLLLKVQKVLIRITSTQVFTKGQIQKRL